MNKSDKESLELVNNFLTSVLKSCYVEPQDDSQLVIAPPNTKPTEIMVAVTKDKKTRKYPVYLPAEDNLSGDGYNKYKYFPFAEDMFLGNSEMLNLTIRLMSARLHLSTYLLIEALIKTKLDKDDKGYGEEVIEILKGLNIKKIHGGKIMNILRAAKKANPFGVDALAAIGLDQKPAGYNREAYLRVVNTDKDKMFGLDPDQQTRDLFKTIIEKIFGNLEDYYSPSKSKVCPGFFAVLGTFAMAADRINQVAEELGAYKDDTILIHSDWFEMLQDEAHLETYHTKHLKLKLPGNIGKAKDNSVSVSTSEEPKVASRLNLGRNSNKNPSNNTQHIAQNENVQEESHAEEPQGRASGGLGGKLLSKNPNIGTDLNGNPVSRGNLGAPPASGRYNPNPQPQQNYSVHGQANYPQGNQPGPRYNVIRPEVTRSVREYHMRDAYGNLLYYQSGQPYIAEADTDTIYDMYWVADQYGNPLYNYNGEPELAPMQGGNMHYHQQNQPQQNTGLFGNRKQNVGSGHLPSDFPTMQQISQMPYTEAAYWRRQIQQYEEEMKSRNSFGSYNGYGNSNQSSFGNGGAFRNRSFGQPNSFNTEGNSSSFSSQSVSASSRNRGSGGKFSF